MKICALLGSPRKKGNTALVLNWVLDEANNAGHNTELIYLYDKKISGCAECFACRKVKDRPGCALGDDMQAVYTKILKADCIILASPVFCYWFSAPVKLFLDRLYAVMKQLEDGRFVSLIEGKSCGLVVTAGDDESGGADLVLETYRRITDGFRMKNIGHIILTGIHAKEDLLKPAIEESARKIARNIR